MEARQKRFTLNCQEDTRKASENREGAGQFESDHMFANDQHGNQHGEEGVQTCDQYSMVNIIPLLLGGTVESATLL